MDKLIEAKNLCKYFKTPRGMLHAVDGVSFSIERGLTLGVVGESGCGKSTLGLLLLHLESITSGNILFEGKDITNPTRAELKELRQDMQMIFQDPFSSLDPRQSIMQLISEPIKEHKLLHGKAEIEKIDVVFPVLHGKNGEDGSLQGLSQLDILIFYFKAFHCFPSAYETVVKFTGRIR